MNYFPRSSAVKAIKLTADKTTFVLNFNSGRTSYPFVADNGRAILVCTGPGVATEMQIGDWVVESANGVTVHSDLDFCQKFCPAP